MTDERIDSELQPPQPPEPADMHRERRMWWILVAVGAVAVVGIMALAWPLIGGRLDAAKNLDTASAILSQTDANVTLVISAASGGPSSDTTALAADALRVLPSARSELVRGVALVGTGFDRLTDDEQKRAILTSQALAARVAVLDAAAPIISAEQSASVAVPLATDAWNRAVQASAAEKDAVAAYDLKTATGLTRATTLADQSARGFSAARVEFSEAATAYPDGGLARYVAYMSERAAEVALLQRAIVARRANDISGANALVVSYNAAQTQSEAGAKALPATPAQAIADAFAAGVALDKAALDKARKAADDADAALKSL